MTSIDHPLEIKIGQFQGPLDLLLHLIKQLEVDIYDIPIAEVTQQYLAYLKQMKESQLYVAGEFIVMASTLMAIKSEYLLPRNEKTSHQQTIEPDPREPLKKMLIEYGFYKDLAQELAEKNSQHQKHFLKSPSDLSAYTQVIDLDTAELRPHDLSQAMEGLLKRYALMHPEDRLIQLEDVSIEEKSQDILNRLNDQPHGRLTFMDCVDAASKHQVVVSFLAILELIKSSKLTAKQEEVAGEIILRLNEEEGED